MLEYDFSVKKIEQQYGFKAANEARKKQTCIRIQNVKAHVQMIEKLNSGHFTKLGTSDVGGITIDRASAETTQRLVRMLEDSFDMKKLVLAGHSFGGVTAFSSAISMDVEKGDHAVATKAAAVILLDPANQWIPDHLRDALEDSNKSVLKGIPTLSVFSQVWYDNDLNKNYSSMLEFSCGKYGNDENSCVMAVQGSQHLGLCDIFSFLPKFVGKIFPYFSQKSNSHKVIRQVNHLALNFLFLNGLSYKVPDSSTAVMSGTPTRQDGNRQKRKDNRKKKKSNSRKASRESSSTLGKLKFVVGFQQ